MSAFAGARAGAGAVAGAGAGGSAGGGGADPFDFFSLGGDPERLNDFLKQLSRFLVSGGFGGPGRGATATDDSRAAPQGGFVRLGIRGSGRQAKRVRRESPARRTGRRTERRTALRATLDLKRAERETRKAEQRADRLRELEEKLKRSRRRALTTDIRSPIDKAGDVNLAGPTIT